MRVRDLKAILADEDDDDLVILQSDSEGNGYSPLSSVYIGKYKANNTWSGTVGLTKLTQDLIEQGFTEEDVCDGEPAIVLVPIN